MATSPPQKTLTDYPFYWFALLEESLESGNLTKAAESQRQLERLGFTVKFSPRRVRRVKAVSHA